MPYSRNIVFAPAVPAPANGYRFRYRIQGSGAAYITLTSGTSPIVVSGLADGATYEGLLDSDCGGGTFSYPAVPLTLLPPGVTTTTTTTSTTTTAYFNVELQSSLPGTSVTSTTGIAGYSMGGQTLEPGEALYGTHNAFSGAISVVIAGPPIINGHIILSKNNVPLQCINVTTGLLYPFTAVFASQSFLATDFIEVDLGSGACSGSNFNIYYGARSGNGYPSAAEILGGSPPTLQDPNTDVAVDWSGFNATPLYCYTSIPASVPDKNFWYVSPINNGTIGNPGDLFEAPQNVIISGVTYKTYKTNYPTQFNTVCYMQIIGS